MSEIYRTPTVEWWKSQVGYTAGANKSNKYFATLDSVSWYNGKKNNSGIDWCCGFYDCGIYENVSDKSVNFGRSVVFEPNYDNCGAGCKQKVDYYKAKNAWYDKMSDACIGDEIFFWSSAYKSSLNPYGVYHTGAVVDWDDKGIYTVEGNVNGGKVADKFYAYGTGKVLGFGRPAWTAKDAPQPEPTPTPDPSPIKTYTVGVHSGSFLNVRTGAGTSYDKVGELYKGAVVTVFETNGNWARISGDLWVSMDYLR